MMNMKRTFFKKIWMIGLGTTFFTFSCTNLDEELYDQVTADNFFQTEQELIAGLGAAYSSFGGLGNHSNLWSTSELVSDELVITTKGGDWFDGGVLQQLHLHTFTPDNGFFNNTWGMLYGGVNTANRLIYQFEDLKAKGNPSADAFIAELRGIRALWYYWIMDGFGRGPLTTDFTDTEVKAASTRQELYNFIESELNAIIDVLPTAKDATTYGRMTKWAALSVRAKLYLNAGVYTGTPQWAKAAADAKAIIDGGKFNLEATYKDNFAVNNSGSNENIFVYPYDKVFNGGFNWPMMTLHYASQTVYNFTDQPWNGYSVVEEFYNSYSNPVTNPGPQGPVWLGLAVDANNDKVPDTQGTLDARLSNFVVGPQYKPNGEKAIDPAFEGATAAQPDPDGTNLNFTPKLNELGPNSWRQGGARIGKYAYELGGTANMSNDFVVFRYADILLIRAEALWRQNNADAEALTLVNQIRTRAKVDPFVSLTDDNLLAERGREMFAEMTRRQDLIRFGKFASAWGFKPAKASSATTYALFPIPKQQLDANSKLTQNPGY
jgi:starch-binding outer membrane protein, SusD/RagB family